MPLSNLSKNHLKHSEIAILVFSRRAKKELLAKSLPANHRGLEWAESLHRRAARVASSSGVYNFLLSENDQIGEGLPQRLCNAFEEYFALGFKAVIALASDVPELSKAHIAAAVDALQTNTAVLGPTFDGGDYLIGISESHYARMDMLAALADKEKVHVSLLSKFQSEESSCRVLPTLRDIDNLRSLQQWLKERPLRKNALVQIGLLLLRIEENRSWDSKVDSYLPQYQFLSGLSRRGPPVWI